MNKNKGVINMKDSGKLVIPIFIFIFSLSIFCLYYFKFMNQGFIFIKYPFLAQNILKSGWLGNNVFGDNLLYIYFHAILLNMFGEHALTSARIIQFILGSVLTYFIGKKLFNSKVGIVASVIQALYGTLIIYAGSFLPETLIIFFNLFGILYLLKFEENKGLINLSMQL